MSAAAMAGGFTASSGLFTGVLAFLGGAQAAGLSHGELEAQLDTDGRALLRQLFQDHLDLRAQQESGLDEVTGADGVTRGRAETGHTRPLATMFGEVTVTRIAYRAPGRPTCIPLTAC